MIENKLFDYDEKILTDYIKFLSTEEGTDILPYAYLSVGNAYDNLIQNSKEYYLFNDEVSLIKKNNTELRHYLSDIDNIIEIGPGSNHTVMNKTLPILQYAKKVKTYLPVDISADYLTDACDTIKKYMPKLTILPIEHDIIKSPDIKFNDVLGKKAIIFFGSTLGNFDENLQYKIITRLYNMLQPDDMLFITLDTYLEKDALLKAYSGTYSQYFLKGSLNYFSFFYHGLNEVKDKFEFCCKWNEKENYVESFFKIKENFTLTLPNNENIKIVKGQELRGTKSRKFNQNKIFNLLNNCNFSILDILDNSNKMQMFVCKR